MPPVLESRALTTPDRVRDFLGCSESDARLTRIINGLSSRLESVCGRNFGYKRWTSAAPLPVAGNGRPKLYLRHYPIRAVEQIIINGLEFPTFLVDSTVDLPMYGQRIYRTPEWDEDGLLYCPLGWSMWSAGWADLTGDPNLDPGRRLYNIRIAYTGGWILPKYDGLVDPDHNPDGLAADLPDDLEMAVATEIESRLSRSPGLTQERTPGGFSQQWQKSTSEFCDEALPTFLSYCTPEARWA